MNRGSAISLGPGASSLILIFVILTMTILGMLSLMTSRYDIRFSERMAEVSQYVYALNEQAEETRAEIDGILAACAEEAGSDEEYLDAVYDMLPDDMELDEDEISWIESDDVRILDCALRVSPLSEPVRSQWVRHDLTTESEY